MARKPTPGEAQAKLCAINARLRAAWTDEAFSTTADGRIHEGQLRLLRSTADRVLVGCTPRAGKTLGVLKLGANACLDTPDTTFLYLAITSEQARKIAWRPWKRMLKKAGIVCDHLDANLTTTFPNGSVAYFAGADDVAQIMVFLGMSLAGGVVVLDEVQERSDAVLEPLIEDVIVDRLTDLTEEHPTPGRLICIGSLPRAKGGWFWRRLDEAKRYEDAAAEAKSQDKELVADPPEFERHGWSRLDNPFLKRQREMFEKWLVARHLTEADPLALRVWKAELIYDTDAGKPYRYDQSRNSYTPERPDWADTLVVRSGKIFAGKLFPGIVEVLVAMDLGGADRASIQALGYGPSTPLVQHVFDWTSERDQHFTWGELLPILQLLQRHLPVVGMFYDAGADGTEHDEFSRMYGIPLIAAANKKGMVTQIRRASEMLMQGRIKGMLGSATVADWERAIWDRRELARGKWKLAIGPNKVDASEAFRYALAAYNDGYRPPRVPPTPAQMVEMLINQSPPPPTYGYQEDPELARLRGGSSSDSYGPPD